MRYYFIKIANSSGQTLKQWTSHINGAADPGAHQVEIDVPRAVYATPVGDSSVTVWGISKQDIAQSSDWNGATIDVYGGMGAGLPLANPAQQGLLVHGMIWQAYANWIGTEMTLNFVIKPSGISYSRPANIVVNWRAGTPLAQALATTLKTAFPTLKQQINISANLVLPHDEYAYYHTLEQLAAFLQSVTNELFGASYGGVQLFLAGDTIIAYDGTTKTDPKVLLFTDLVGQPTWIAQQQAQITTVLRGDLQVGNYIKMPVGFVPGAGSLVTTPQSYSQYTSTSVFQGTMLINAVRHIGNFRNPDGRAWVSIFNCTIDQ